MSHGPYRLPAFRYRGRRAPALLRFLAVQLIAYLANLGTVVLLVDQLSVNGYVAQAVGTIPYTVTNYLASRFWVFRNTDGQTGQE